MSDELIITPQEPSGPSALLVEYLWTGPGSDRAAWTHRSGERWRTTSSCRSTPAGLRRSLTVTSPSGRRIDQLEFLITRSRFVERAADGRLLADLPATLALEQPAPLGDTGEVRLQFCGEVEAALGTRRERLEAIALSARVEGTRRIQWLARGIGELALGSPAGGFDRWLTGWEGGDRILFGGVS